MPDTKPLLNVQSPAEVEAADAAQLERKEVPKKAIEGLAALIRAGFTEAKNARTSTIANGMDSLDTRLRESRRQCLCIYDSKILAAIKADGGTEEYDPLTIGKCLTFESWARDIVAPADDKPWALEPTPIPEMTEDIEAQMDEKAREYYETKIPKSVQDEESPEAQDYIYNKMSKYGGELKDEVDKERIKESRARAARMERRIHDQLVEGGFMTALNDFIEYLSRTPLGILKGPVYKTVKKVSRRPVKQGLMSKMMMQGPKFESYVEMKQVRHFYAPRTEDVYFSQGALSINSGDIYEIVRLQASELQNLRNTIGYDTTKVDEVLALYGRSGIREWSNDEGGDRDHTGIPNQENSVYNGEIDAIDYWGMKQGKDLKGTTLAAKVEDNIFYQVHCMTVGGIVILSEMNPDPLGRKPYRGTPFEKQAGYVYGRGLPEKIRPAQRGANVARRGLINNIAIGSGPQCMITTGALADGEKITALRPFRIWQLKQRQGGGQDTRPITFFQPDMRTAELTAVLEKFYNDADRDTGIPRYVQGDPNASVRGASATASGLSMLMNAATKTVKNVLRNIDEDVIREVVQQMYDLNMLDPNVPEDEKGDFEIRVKGSLNMAIKEQMQATRMNFLQLVLSSEKLMEMIGPKAVMALVREVTKTLDMPPHFLPTDSELKVGKEAEYRALFENSVDNLFRNGIIDEQVAQLLLDPDAALQAMEANAGQNPQQQQGQPTPPAQPNQLPAQ